MSKLKMGIVGAGLWGAQHARVFKALPETELAAICDVDPARAGKLRAGSPEARVFTDYRDLIGCPDVDAISIATPDFTHTPIILAALEAGKHCLSEKPLATTVAQAEQVAESTARSSARLMVDFHNRVNPVVVEMQAAVAGGEIGRVVHGNARLSNTTFVPLEMLSWAARSSALWFLGSHALDALRFILGDEVVRVYAVARDGVLRSRGVDTQDVHLSVLEFAGGTVVTMENSWVLSPDNPMVFDFKIEMVGEAGQLQGDPSHNGSFRKLDGKGLRYADLLGIAPTGDGRVGGFVLESIARFVDAVLRDAPLLATAEDGLACTRVLAAIEQSAASGSPVSLQ